MQHRLKIEHIHEAAEAIDPVFLNSPQYVTEALSLLIGARVIVKVETANPLRCFKGRGADYLVSKLPEGSELITASAGNLGMAMAYACRRRGFRLTVYASATANPLKVDGMRALGAEVVLSGKDFDEAKIEAKHAAQRLGLRMIEDSLDVETGEGAGTIGLELVKFPERLDAVLMALGNGALVCGVGRYFKHASPETRVIAVQAAGAPAMLKSWAERKIVSFQSVSTIADGIAIRVPIPECVQDLDGVIDEGIFVQENAMIEAMRLAHQHLGLVLEPSGAAGLAALLENREKFKGQTVAVILCGGNLTVEQARTWLN